MSEKILAIWMLVGFVAWLSILYSMRNDPAENQMPILLLVVSLVFGPLLIIGVVLWSIFHALKSDSTSESRRKSRKKATPRISDESGTASAEKPKIEPSLVEPAPTEPSAEFLEQFSLLYYLFSDENPNKLTKTDFIKLQKFAMLARREMKVVGDYFYEIREMLQFALKRIDEVFTAGDKTKEERRTILKDSFKSFPKAPKPEVTKQRMVPDTVEEHPIESKEKAPKVMPEAVEDHPKKSKQKPTKVTQDAEQKSQDPTRISISIGLEEIAAVVKAESNKSRGSKTKFDELSQDIVTAALMQQWTKVLQLINQGVSPNQQFTLGSPEYQVHLLTYAAAHAPIQVLKRMLELGADTNACIDDCSREDTVLFTPLIAAASRDHETLGEKPDVAEKIMILLVDSGVPVNPFSDGESALTPFIAAACTYRFKAVERLIQAGADINIANSRGENAYFVVSSYEEDNHTKKNRMLRLLMEAGVDTNRLTTAGLNALHYSVLNQFERLLNFHLNDAKIPVLAQIASTADASMGRDALEMCFQLPEKKGSGNWSVTQNIMDRLIISVTKLNRSNSKGYEPNLSVWAAQMRSLGQSQLTDKKKFRNQIDTMIQALTSTGDWELSTWFVLEDFIHLLKQSVTRNFDDSWLVEVLNRLLKNALDVNRELARLSKSKKLEITAYFPAFRTTTQQKELTDAWQAFEQALPNTAAGIIKLFDQYGVDMSFMANDIKGNTADASRGVTTNMYKPSTKFVSIVCDCANPSKDADASIKKLTSYLKNSRDKISVNDIFVIVEVLADSDSSTSKKLVSAMKKVINALAKDVEDDYEYAFAGYQRHFVHLFDHAEEEFNVPFAQSAIEKCSAKNPKGLALLTAAFGLYAFPALERPLTNLDFKRGHHYAVYEGLLEHKDSLIKVVSHVLMNYYDTIDELCWVVNLGVTSSYEDYDEYRENFLLGLRLPYLGDIIGYVSFEHAYDDATEELRLIQEEAWEDIGIDPQDALKYEYLPAVLTFLMNHWDAIIASRIEYERNIDTSWLPKFKKFAYLIRSLDWEIKANRSLLESIHGLSDVVSRLLSKRHEFIIALDPIPEFDEDSQVLKNRHQAILDEFIVDVIGLTDEIMAPPKFDLSVNKNFVRRFYLKIRSKSDYGKHFDPAKNLDRQLIQPVIDVLSDIAKVSEINFTIGSDKTYVFLEMESAWQRHYPKERYSLEQALVFLKSSRDEPDAYVVNCSYAFLFLELLDESDFIVEDAFDKSFALVDSQNDSKVIKRIHIESSDCVSSLDTDEYDDYDDDDDD